MTLVLNCLIEIHQILKGTWACGMNMIFPSQYLQLQTFTKKLYLVYCKIQHAHWNFVLM